MEKVTILADLTDGRMKIGWQQIEGKWVYLGTDGAVRTGWQQVGGCWYYLGKHGEMETGFRNIDGLCGESEP